MTFAALIFKNVVRQKIRTALTVLGIAIGITTVVALGAVVGGLKQTAGAILQAYDSDFIVAQKGSSDLTFSTVPEEEVAQIRALPDVDRAIGALIHVSKIGDNPYFITIGVRPEDLSTAGPSVIEGRMPETANEIAIGSRAASDHDLGVGETLTIDRNDLTIVGVYDANNLWEDSGAYAPLVTVQEIARKPGVVTMVYVKVAEGSEPRAVATAIEDGFPSLTTVSNVSEYSEVDQGIEIIDAVNLAISALAVGIGAIGVMNTMIMSVFERTREIGILRAVGWSGGRILRMIIGESLVLCLIAAVVGSLFGVLASRAVILIPAVRSLIEPTYGIDIFVRALVVAIIVALAGAAYPAVRALRLTPMEALRYE
jgi:putative ABC transport system permease protein